MSPAVFPHPRIDTKAASPYHQAPVFIAQLEGLRDLQLGGLARNLSTKKEADGNSRAGVSGIFHRWVTIVILSVSMPLGLVGVLVVSA